jgi:hypothetical protein
LGDDSPRNQNNSDKSPSWRRIVAEFVKAYGDAQRAKDNQKPNNNRAANWTAGATVAIAIFSTVAVGVGISQWNIQSRTLDEQQAENKPFVSFGDDSSSPQFHAIDASGKGQILWEWGFMNSGRGIAEKLTIAHFIKIGRGPFKFSFQTGPVYVGDFPPNAKRVILTATGPDYTKEEFDALMKGDFGIRIRTEFTYSQGVKTIMTLGCMAHSKTGATAFLPPKECAD